MKTGTAASVLVLSLMTAEIAARGGEQTPPPSVAASTNGVGPRIQFETNIFNFGKVNAGEIAKFAITFTNTGDRLLEISAVQPQCGCTAAGDWSRQVEPGKSGTIPLEFHSAGYPGGPVEKMLTVMCNDASQPTVMLRITGTIWQPIEVTPQFAFINVLPDAPSNATTVVRIVNNMEQPLGLFAPEINNRAFAAELQMDQPGKEYRLIVKAVPPVAPGTPQGQITLKTSSPQMPVINITAHVNVQPALSAMPSVIMLPLGVISNKLPTTVTIQNYASKPLALSDPTVNAKGVAVELKELQPGRLFNVTMTFPEGFQIPQGEMVELNVKSDQPQNPVIKVPITQPPPPVPPAVR